VSKRRTATRQLVFGALGVTARDRVTAAALTWLRALASAPRASRVFTLSMSPSPTAVNRTSGEGLQQESQRIIKEDSKASWQPP